MNEFLSYVLGAPLACLAVYVVVRVASAAFFRSKHDFERKTP